MEHFINKLLKQEACASMRQGSLGESALWKDQYVKCV